MLILIQSSLIISSVAILWRSTLNKNHKLGPYLRKVFPVFLGTALTCGLCFTYWVALFFIILFNPLPVEFFSFNYGQNFWIHIFFSWMSLGFVSVFLRFLFAFMQEKVNYYHSLNNNGEHKH